MLAERTHRHGEGPFAFARAPAWAGEDMRTDDLIRIPANSNSRVSLESEGTDKAQVRECNNLLRSST